MISAVRMLQVPRVVDCVVGEAEQCTVGQIRGFCPMGILSNMELSVEVCAGLLQSVPMGAAECVQGYRVIKYFLKFLKNIFWRKKIF